MLINRCWNCMEDLGEKDVCPHCGFDPDRQRGASYALRPNTILRGKYLVGNVLGRGGYGITYIGFDLTLEMKVAIKEYFPADKAMRNSDRSNALIWRQSDDPGDSWRNGCVQFLSEARKMARINSIPEIVSVRDTFEENNTAYIVMDYVPGKTMKAYMEKNGYFTFEECVSLLSPVIEGLDKVHRQGLIHRDISPDNLMLTPEGKVYLLDLGAAKDMKDRSGKDTPASKRGFSPLEQDSSAGTIGPWTDVYALAASIYYCVYGKLIPSAMERFEEDKLSFSGKAKKSLTPAQIAVLKKGLSIKQELRYQTAMEFLIALRDAAVPRKKKGKLIAAIAAIIVLAVGAVTGSYLYTNKPWLPVVEECGSIGPYFDSNFVIVDGEYEYFVDLDKALVRVPYNQEAETFYLDTAEVLYDQNDDLADDGYGGFNMTEDKIYAVYYGGKDSEGVEYPGYLFSMNHDGSDQQQLQEVIHDVSSPQYVKLSDGTEYLYYMMDDGTEEDTYHLHLYRYNIQTQTLETPVTEEVQWYGVYRKYLYYNIWDETEEKYLLYRATLAGEDPKLVDDVHNFWCGVVADDKLYLIQITDVNGNYSIGLVQCDENGQPLTEGTGIFGVDWTNATWTVGGGWIYYNEGETDELYRIRLDGTEKSQILSGYQYEKLCYCNYQLYFQDGVMEGEEFIPYQAHIAGDDGSWIAECNFKMNYLTDEQGVQYIIENGYAKAVGYVGTDEDVILPLEFNGYPFNDSVNWDEFFTENVPLEKLRFYALMQESELTYTKNADGITITGYSGKITGAMERVAIPTEIDGAPVIDIGKEAFAGCTFKRVYLPEGLLNIGESAFDGCGNLIGVVFPETLKNIDSFAFYKTSFEGENIVFPEGLEDMGRAVLYGADPESVYLPASLDNFSDGFLAGCGGEYHIDPNNSWLKTVNGILFSKSGKTLYAFPWQRAGSYSVPADVTRIDEYAFYLSELSSVTLPNGVKEIGSWAFKGADKLANINIPRSVTSLGEEAFYDTALTSVTIKWGTKGEKIAFDEDVRIIYYED